MTLILGEFTLVRRLGSGGFGEVYLVQNKNKERYAIKQMNKIKIGQIPEHLQYVDNQIKIMESLQSEYIVRLERAEDTEKFIYLILEFCNCGDLKKQQGKQQNKVYTLDMATKALSDVIRGLEVIHTKGYIHRDLKIENILACELSDGSKKYKIADFGLSKSTSIGETVLGTGHYMSPEIFSRKPYSFEVDMWAFGVVFFYMLNKTFPFKLSPHIDDTEYQYESLVQQAKNFSYRKSVIKTPAKMMVNCTDDMEDLFSRIFQLNADLRITFSQIRKHPIFKKHFPEQINEQSRLIYKKNPKITDNIFTKVSKIHIKQRSEEANVEQKVSFIRKVRSEEQYAKQKLFISHKNSQIGFLYENFKEFKEVHGILTSLEKISLCYNLIKYFILLKRNFIGSLRSGTFFTETAEHKALKFSQFSRTDGFKQQVKQLDEQFDDAILQFETLYFQCNDCLQDIEKINDQFKGSFASAVTETEFQNPFKKSYRKSTLYTFNKLKKFMKEKTSGNKYSYFLAQSVICHVFNRLFLQRQNTKKVFKQYLEQSKQTVEQLNYEQLREWMTKANPLQLNTITKNIISKYFESG